MMDNQKFIDKCIEVVKDSCNLDNADGVFVVWSCKTLQNNKAILSHTGTDAPLFEITHDGNKGVFYVDTYEKTQNKLVEL